MQAILREMRLGWRDARWGVYFTRWFIPTWSVAILLAWLIDGKVTTPPSSLTWGLCLLAAVGSYVWAGLRDGPDGYLGRFFWRLILLGGWSLLMRRTTSAPGKEKIVTINLAGYSYVLSA